VSSDDEHSESDSAETKVRSAAEEAEKMAMGDNRKSDGGAQNRIKSQMPTTLDDLRPSESVPLSFSHCGTFGALLFVIGCSAVDNSLG
jgi:hypothetical protein